MRRRKWAVSPLFLFVETVSVYRDIPEELRALIEPIVDEAGFELVDAQLARGGKPWTLKVTIDTPECDGRVPVDGCAAISRELGSQLDVAETIKADYRLEVSSPGLDRPLTREKDFASACGGEVQIETRQPISGRRRFRGVLLRFEAGCCCDRSGRKRGGDFLRGSVEGKDGLPVQPHRLRRTNRLRPGTKGLKEWQKDSV